jgi:tartrate/fumarate subfamily iron-sulfur-dependent hydro-lyase beta chain
MVQIKLPFDDKVIQSLKVGDSVSLSGIMVTGRDSIHKWLIETFIRGNIRPNPQDKVIYESIVPLLRGGAIYHCGPVVSGLETGDYQFVAAGPTTSTREEPYQGDVMRHFKLQGVIGKGGMGSKTLAACREVPGVYLHAIGGAASIIAQTVKKVVGVYKMEFGVPEAMWVIEVQEFPAVVTMDAHGNSLHAEIEQRSKVVLEELFEKA